MLRIISWLSLIIVGAVSSILGIGVSLYVDTLGGSLIALLCFIGGLLIGLSHLMLYSEKEGDDE